MPGGGIYRYVEERPYLRLGQRRRALLQPAPALLARMAELRFDVTHLYGLTETYGPAAICEWKPAWDDLDRDEQARLKARQGVANLVSLPLRVLGNDGTD